MASEGEVFVTVWRQDCEADIKMIIGTETLEEGEAHGPRNMESKST